MLRSDPPSGPTDTRRETKALQPGHHQANAGPQHPAQGWDIIKTRHKPGIYQGISMNINSLVPGIELP